MLRAVRGLIAAAALDQAVAIAPPSSAKRLSLLSRSELASVAYGPTGAHTPEDMRSAHAQLAANDGAYLAQAATLAAQSGDERVYWSAQVALDENRSEIERAGPSDEQAPPLDIAGLKRDIAAKTLQHGEQQALSLRYPNGWSAPASAPLPSPPDTSAIPAGATRAALAYRAAGLFDD